MRYLIFGDLHFHNAGPVTKGYTEQLDICFKTCQWIAELIGVHKPDIVINLGDTNHSLGYVDLLAVDAMYWGMKVIADACRTQKAPYVIMSGNHDQYSRDGRYGIVTIFRDLGLIVADSMDIPEYDMLAVAYHRDEAEFLKRIQGCERKYLFMHQDISGSMVSKNYYIEDGVDPVDLRNFERVFNGHLHHPSKVTGLASGTDVTMVGSPIYHNFQDHIQEQPRGILLLDTQGDESRMWNPATPFYHTMELFTNEDAAQIRTLLKTYDIERINMRFITTDAWMQEVEKTRSKWDRQYKSLKYVIRDKEVVAEPEMISMDTGFSEALDSYVELAETDLNKEQLRQMGKDILEECTA